MYIEAFIYVQQRKNSIRNYNIVLLVNLYAHMHACRIILRYNALGKNINFLE